MNPIQTLLWKCKLRQHNPTYDALTIAGYVLGKYYELYEDSYYKSGLGVNNRWLQFALYFIHTRFLVATGRPLFRDKIVAMESGPVILSVYKKYKMYGDSTIPPSGERLDKYGIREEDRMVLDPLIWTSFDGYSLQFLMKVIHNSSPWKKACKTRSKVITNDSLAEWYARFISVGERSGGITMKKIPTLFERQFENHNIVKILPNITPGMEWVLKGEGVPTIKWDGACCAVINGIFYKRYDAKNGKKVPEGAIPCEKEPDPVTGHLPCWLKCDREKPEDKWFWVAYDYYRRQRIKKEDGIFGYVFGEIKDGTYEAIGPHFQGNPYGYDQDILRPHGKMDAIWDLDCSFEGIRDYLEMHSIEGIVFWKDGEPQCKIKRTDFGLPWPLKEKDDA